jgi:hypothetical protein
MGHLLLEGRRWLRALLPAVALAASLWGQTAAEESLPVLARVGPWPVVSRLIGYDGRLWLANSVTGVNHNSADLYSYDPLDGRLRYERHLFSQDAGQPLVAGGLLYWPFEDSRFSLGWGHYMATDGTAWRFGTVPTAQIFHVHAMAARGAQLVAATSAWRAGLQVSRDGGLSWRQAYDHPTPERRVSRITELAVLGDRVLGPLRGPEGWRLLRFDGTGAVALPGWPRDRAMLGLAVFRDRLYGLVREAGGVAVWRSDGRRSERVTVPRPGWAPVGLAADDGGLWAVGAEGAGGALWHSADGADWARRYRLAGGEPREVALYGGRPYAAGAGADGRGILWGPPPPALVEARAAPPDAAPRDELPEVEDWEALGAALDRALANIDDYAGHGRVLRDLVFRAARAGPPEGFFSGRLARGLPDRPLPMIGGAVEVPAAELGRWILLWGMAVAGRGRVPPELIAAPWTAPPNSAEKYFETAPAAIWAAARVGQKDRATIAALIARLDLEGDPDWLRGDLAGALTALTGRRFAYDVAAWRRWWAEAAATWPR